MSKFRHIFAAHVTAEMRDAANALANERGWRGAVYSVYLQPIEGGVTHYGLLTRTTDAFVIEMALASTGQPPEWAEPEEVASVLLGLSEADPLIVRAVMDGIEYKTIPLFEYTGTDKEIFDGLLLESGLKVYTNEI